MYTTRWNGITSKLSNVFRPLVITVGGRSLKNWRYANWFVAGATACVLGIGACSSPPVPTLYAKPMGCEDTPRAEACAAKPERAPSQTWTLVAMTNGPQVWTACVRNVRLFATSKTAWRGSDLNDVSLTAGGAC